MHQAIKDAIGICKTLLRNGYDAHVINAPMQAQMIDPRKASPVVIDIACEPGAETLQKFFPGLSIDAVTGSVFLEENDSVFRFYPLDPGLTSHPELSLLRITPGMIDRMPDSMRKQMRISEFEASSQEGDPNDGFASSHDGQIRLPGIPDDTLRHNYLLAIRALRFAANYDMPIEPNTWMAIVRASVRIIDYVPASDIMAEWRKVSAESMHRFVRLLYETHILQGLMPEVASLVCVTQAGSKTTSNVFEHTLKCMELYPQDELHYDWLGTMAMLFHDIGKLYTAEYFDNEWTYYQHHRVGAKVTRKILRRFHFDIADTDLICALVNNHMNFHFMLTDRGIRRFKALGETGRLIAMARADLLSKDDNLTSFNHNIKYLARAETPEEMLEPLLNGNEIMEYTHLSPGPQVGILRNALLEAQKCGDVKDRDSAIAFVCSNVKAYS